MSDNFYTSFADLPIGTIFRVQPGNRLYTKTADKFAPQRGYLTSNAVNNETGKRAKFGPTANVETIK